MPFILIIIGLALIIYNYKAIKKENEVEKDFVNISFQGVLDDNKDELNEYKMEIGILRRDIAESLTELQEEIIGIKKNINNLKNSMVVYDNKEDYENIQYNKDDLENEYLEEVNQEEEVNKQLLDNSDDDVISEISFSKKEESNKTHNIKKLLEEGMTIDEICHQLSVSKGEVLLVKGLFKK